MHNNLKKPIFDLHSDAWWMRAFEGELSAQESLLWEAHLQQCEKCRVEWDAIMRVDMLLRTAPPPPSVAESFAVQTAVRVVQKQRLRRLLSFWATSLLVVLVSWIVLGFLGSTYSSLGRVVGFVISGRQVLFGSLMRTLVSLFVSWKTVLPGVLALVGTAFLLLMPNGILATLLIFWFARRQTVPVTVTNSM